LRGAGNLLGGEQSGHAQAVGFDMYLRWLQETVDALKGGEGQAGSATFAPPEVILDRPAHLPDSYVPDAAAKLDPYRRLRRLGGEAIGPGLVRALTAVLQDSHA